MKIDEIVTNTRDAITVRRVFAEPYVQEGVTVIAAAKVSGGAGGGGGQDQEGQSGEGGGFGIQGRPVGAYVIKNGQVTWMPAVDVNRVVTAIAFVVATYLITHGRIEKMRAKAALADRLLARTKRGRKVLPLAAE